MNASFGELAEAEKKMLRGSCAGIEDRPADTRLSPEYFESFMAEAVSTTEERGVPLYCGEYGVIDKASQEDTLAWYKMINAAFEKYGIGRAAWSCRKMDFGISDARMDGARDELLKHI